MSRREASTQGSISSYFQANSTPQRMGKRVGSPIDLTLEDEEERSQVPLKRPRLTGPGTSSSSNAFPEASSLMRVSNPVADSWRYSPEKSKQQVPFKPRTEHEKERHQAFKRKLLQDNSFLLKKDYEEPEKEQKNSEKEGQEDSGNESDRFQQLSDMFSHQSKGKKVAKSKTTAHAKTRTKVIELGPSGEPYTPLEKQASGQSYRLTSAADVISM
jgi:DNA mismatch repair protein MSH3